MQRWSFQVVGLIAVVMIVAAGGLLFMLYPWHPTTPLGWALVVVLALPVMVAGEWLGNVVLGNRFARSIGRDQPPGRISWARIAYGAAALLVVAASVFGILAVVGVALGT
jgi:hypothetical protein